MREEARTRDIEPGILHYARIDLELLNGKIEKTNISYEEELPGYTNYYLPACPKGMLQLKTYNKLRIKDIYPGIDWVWRNEAGTLHHEFEIEPGADISRLKIKVKWADIAIEKDGKRMVLNTPLGAVVDGELVAYEIPNPRTPNPVEVFYQKEADGIISFKVSGYSGKSTLIIDPPLSLLWATYYGGTAADDGYSITTDADGNVLVTGHTLSANFPCYNPGSGAYYDSTQNGDVDLFVLKFTNTGVRRWATYYGGSAIDSSYSICTDDAGNVFVTGATLSTNFPCYNPGSGAHYDSTHNGSLDLFVLKFTNSGVREWATYYGAAQMDHVSSITADPFGNVFVTGFTASAWFPTYDPGGGAYYDPVNNGTVAPFILKFTNTGVRQWATFYEGGYWAYGTSITTDPFGNVFVTGVVTLSTNFSCYDPGGGAYYDTIRDGVDDLFLLKFSNTGVRKWATLYGGNASDTATSITTDPSGNVFVTGMTRSTDFPCYNPGGGAFYDSTHNGYADLFLLKFTNTGVRQWATYYGGSEKDYGSSICTDSAGNLFVTGRTMSPNFPTHNPGAGAYYDSTHNGASDLFLLKFGTPPGIEEEQASASSPLLRSATFFKDRLVLRLLAAPKEPVESSLYNAIGEKVLEKICPADHSITISGKGIDRLQRGVYFLILKSGNKTIGKVKLIKV